MYTAYIFLDDIREPPDDGHTWILSRTTNEAYMIMRAAYVSGYAIHLSLDHDLGEDEPTGYDLVKMIERDVLVDQDMYNITFNIHSANPVGRANMQRAIDQIIQKLKVGA